MANAIPEEGRPIGDPNNINSQISEYVRIKATMATMEARSKELRDNIFSEIDVNGYEDNNGNYQLDLPQEIDGVVRLEKQRRATRKLNEDIANEIIAMNGLEDQVTRMVREIDEEALMAAYYEEKITEDELDRMFPVNVVWALRTLKK